jgi:hypothetical protein
MKKFIALVLASTIILSVAGIALASSITGSNERILRVTSDQVNDAQFAVTRVTLEANTDYIIGMRWRGDPDHLFLGLGSWNAPAHFFNWNTGRTSWLNVPVTAPADDWQVYETPLCSAWFDYLHGGNNHPSAVRFAAGNYLFLGGAGTDSGNRVSGKTAYIDEFWIYNAADPAKTNILVNGDFSDFSDSAIRREAYSAGTTRTNAMNWVLAGAGRWSLFAPAYTLVDPNPNHVPVTPPRTSGFQSPFVIGTEYLGEAGLRDVRLSSSQEFADPHMIFHNGNFYVYGTNHLGVAVARSTDNLQTFEHMGLALRSDLAHDNSPYMYWAPEVFYHDGTFYMHYTSSTIGSGANEFQHRLRVATSDNPLGPFENPTLLNINASPPGAAHQGWAIDPHMVHRTFTNEQGEQEEEFVLFYAVHAWSPPVLHAGCTGPACGTGCNYANANSRTGASFGRGQSGANNFFGVQIYMQKFSDPATPIPGTQRLALWATVREEFNPNANMYTVEGPVYFEYDGVGYLMYSGDSWDSPNYFTSYATWDLQGSIMDAEFEKRLVPNAAGFADPFSTVIGRDANANGMGHHSIVIPDSGPLEGVILMAHHGRPADIVQNTLPYHWRTNVRRLYVTEVTTNNGRITAHRMFDNSNLTPHPTYPLTPAPFPDPALPIVFFDSIRDNFEISWRWPWATAWLYATEHHYGLEFDQWRIDRSTLKDDTVIEVYYTGGTPQISVWVNGGRAGGMINPITEISEQGVARFMVEDLRRRAVLDSFEDRRFEFFEFWIGYQPEHKITRIALVEDIYGHELPEGPQYRAGPPANGRAAQFTYTTTGGGGSNDGNFRIQLPSSVVNGRTYTMFFSYAGANGGTFVAEHFWDRALATHTATNEWRAGSLTFTAAAGGGGREVGIRRRATPAGTQIYFANFALYDHATGEWLNLFPNNGNFPATGTSLGSGWITDNRQSSTVPAIPPHFDVYDPGDGPGDVEGNRIMRMISDPINDIQFAVTNVTFEADKDYVMGIRWRGNPSNMLLGIGTWSNSGNFFSWDAGRTSWTGLPATGPSDDWQETEIALCSGWWASSSPARFAAGTYLAMFGYYNAAPNGAEIFIDEVWIYDAADPLKTNLLVNGDFADASKIRSDEYTQGAPRTTIMNWVLAEPGRWSLFSPSQSMIVVPFPPPPDDCEECGVCEECFAECLDCGCCTGFDECGRPCECLCEPDFVRVIGTSFIDISETFENSRIWALTFVVSKLFSDDTTGESIYTVFIGSNNANIDGVYKFDEDHFLAGHALIYDIKGNGSNIKEFFIQYLQ